MIVACTPLYIIEFDDNNWLSAERAVEKILFDICICGLGHTDHSHKSHVEESIFRLLILVIILDFFTRIEDIVEYLSHLDTVYDIWHNKSHPECLFLLLAWSFDRAIDGDIWVTLSHPTTSCWCHLGLIASLCNPARSCCISAECLASCILPRIFVKGFVDWILFYFFLNFNEYTLACVIWVANFRDTVIAEALNLAGTLIMRLFSTRIDILFL